MRIISPSTTDYLKVMVDCQVAMAKETEGMDLDPAIVTKGVTEALNNPTRGRYYLALDEKDNLMGMLLTMGEWSDWRCAEVVWIHSVYIYPQYRGKKIYKQMYQHLKEMVDDSPEYAGLRLYVDKSNLAATSVYQKLGMSDDHYRLFEWLKN